MLVKIVPKKKAPKRQSGYNVFYSEFMRKHKGDRKYREYALADWNTGISAEWAGIGEAKQEMYRKKASSLNLKNCIEPVGPNCTPKASARANTAVVLSVNGKGHSKFFDEIYNGIELHFVQKKTLQQRDLKLIKVKHLENLIALIKRVTNFRVIVDGSDYSDSDVSDGSSYTDNSESDASASYEEPRMKSNSSCGMKSNSSCGMRSKSACGKGAAVRQLELQR